MRTLLPLAAGLLLTFAAPAQQQLTLDLSSLNRPAGSPALPVPAGPPTLTYQPTAALRAQTVEAEAARLQARRPAEANALRMTFGRGMNDYSRLYAHMVEGSGFADNDAASSLGLYLVVAYRINYGIVDDNFVKPDQERGLRSQLAAVLARQPALRHDPTAVARLGESLKLQAVELALDWSREQQHGDEKFRRDLLQHLRTTYGLDLPRLQLTSAGFSLPPAATPPNTPRKTTPRR